MSHVDNLTKQTQTVDFDEAAKMCFQADAQGMNNQQLANQIDTAMLGREMNERGY